MQKKELLQENQYHFPYHHLTHEKDGAIFIFRHLFWGLEHYTYIKYAIDKIANEKFNTLIDFGCGEGRIISDLEQKIPNKKYIGIDISSKAICLAKGFTNSSEFFVHDITEQAFSTKADLAVSFEVIEHIKPDRVSDYCKNIADSLNEGGRFIFTTPTTNVPVNTKHYQHFTLETLTEYLSPYFKIEEVSYLNCQNMHSRFLSRLIANRFYLSNLPILNRWVLKQYNNKLLIGTKTTGSRIYIKCSKL